jgi:hypothetical protein
MGPAEITEFLAASHNIQIENDSNARLTGDQLTLVLQQFGPELLPETPSLLAEETVSVEKDAMAEEQNVTYSVPEEDRPAEDDATREIEVIKAPKVELAGLKVLGKIELPERKKKEPPVEPSASGESAVADDNKPVGEAGRRRRQENNKRGDQSRKRGKDQRPSKNPVAQARERAAREEEEKRQEEARRKKEHRTQHYLKKVKSVPTKPARLVNEQVEQMSAAELEEAPKTWLGKFLKWLTT